MLQPISLLLNKVKGRAKQLYPDEESRIANLSPDTVQLNNFTQVSAYYNKYSTDLTDGAALKAVSQSWASASLFDLDNIKQSFGTGGLVELLATREVGGMLSLSTRVKNIYLVIDDISTDVIILEKMSELLGYQIDAKYCKITRPVKDMEDYISVVIKDPYIASTVFIHVLVDAELKVLPSISIPMPTYAATGKTEQVTPMELLLLNAYPNGWQDAMTQQEFDNLIQAVRYPYVIYNAYPGRYDDGNVSYRSTHGCFFPAVSIGYTNISYTVYDVGRMDYIDFTDLDSLDDLANVTVPGFYRVKSNFIYQFWLMVDDFETVNKDLFNLYSKKLWLSEAELGYRVNGMGDYGTPQPDYKYRGSYTLDNILIHDCSIMIRRIGE